MHDVYRRDGCSCTPTFGHFGLYFLGWVFLHTQTHFVGSWYTSLVKRGFPVHFLVLCGQSLHRSGVFAVEEYQTAHHLAFTVRYVVASLIYGPACFSHSFTLHVLARVCSRCCKGCCFAFPSSTRWVSFAFKLQLTRVSTSVVFAGVVCTRVFRARFVLTHLAWLQGGCT
jgi:hypothetical protein